MKKHPIPHSSEWFERLFQDNPRQALQTAAIIKAAGRKDVCSVCGDEPAHDYVPLGTPTIKTCSQLCECAKIAIAFAT